MFDPEGPRIDDPEDARSLRPICEAVQAEGSLICAQLLHAGRYAKIEGCVAPSPIRAPINRFVPREMTDADIRRTIEDFAKAAENAQAAGFDGVEIMGSEGYLINEFTVTHTNKREDEWGGSAENRHRFSVEIVRAVRERCGSDFLVIYRISAADLVEGGAPAEEIADLARKIEAAGADILNTGIGWHEARVPTIAYQVPRGAWRQAAANVKAAVSIPVVASNRINTPEIAEDILASGEADMISMARPFWPIRISSKRRARAARTRSIPVLPAIRPVWISSFRIDRSAVSSTHGPDAKPNFGTVRPNHPKKWPLSAVAPRAWPQLLRQQCWAMTLPCSKRKTNWAVN